MKDFFGNSIQIGSLLRQGHIRGSVAVVQILDDGLMVVKKGRTHAGVNWAEHDVYKIPAWTIDTKQLEVCGRLQGMWLDEVYSRKRSLEMGYDPNGNRRYKKNK